MKLEERIEAAKNFPALTRGMDIALDTMTEKHGEFVALAAITAAIPRAVGAFSAAEVAHLLRSLADGLDGGQERPM